MPITYRIDPERNLVLTKASGVLKDCDFPEFHANLFRDPQFEPGMMELADYRDVERHELTTDGLMEFLEQENEHTASLEGFRIAIVTHSDLHFGLARMYSSIMHELLGEAQVFRDMEEAEAWLFGESNS